MNMTQPPRYARRFPIKSLTHSVSILSFQPCTTIATLPSVSHPNDVKLASADDIDWFPLLLKWDFFFAITKSSHEKIFIIDVAKRLLSIHDSFLVISMTFERFHWDFNPTVWAISWTTAVHVQSTQSCLQLFNLCGLIIFLLSCTRAAHKNAQHWRSTLFYFLFFFRNPAIVHERGNIMWTCRATQRDSELNTKCVA